MKSFKQTSLALAVSLACAMSAHAQDASSENTEAAQESGLERIVVTAQKRSQSIQEVPISIATLSGEQFENLFSGGGDILELAVRVPGLYAETSNGRVAPRFYIRGLGNTDFDLAASQPVSVIMDDVVMENVVLKSFPLFDIQQVEVIRGPQGTLFGRNTTAGIIKFDSVKPSEDFDAYVKSSYGTFNTFNIEAAVGGSIGEDLAGRFSVLSQNRDDYIDNTASPEGDAIGGFEELAWRGQLLYTPTDDLSILAKLHGRDLDGTASVFRANVFTRGSNDLNASYVRDEVIYDGNLNGNGFDNNPQEYEGFGGSFKVDYDMGDVTVTSITAYEEAEGFSLGDIDGGFGSLADFTPDPRPGIIPFDAVTQDNLDNLEQFTQEIRFASDTDEALSWQLGAFYFDSSFDITSTDGFFGATTVFHENTTWAVFGQATYEVSDKLTVTGGLRYTDDEKSLVVGDQNVNGFAVVIGAASIQDYAPVNVDDGQASFELSANYKLNDDVSLFARYSNGFRAQSIQARDVAFEGAPSVADAETINSIEAGFKADLLDNSLRLNAAIFAYEVDDIQLSAIGGANNGNSLLNADKGSAMGFEIDAQYLVSDNFVLTAGFSYNDTELEDADLLVAPCGANCTVLDPIVNGLAAVNGNPFPQAPETIFNFTARYSIPVGDDGELFAFTDWAFQGDTNLFLYESVEFQTDSNFEGGLRIGYENFADGYSIALFGRNITNEDNVKGAIDFNNLTGIVNEPRIIGIEAKISFY
ncbi:TonB-dependent receptor [Glaciecola sp. XM2]|uniref:TonB-dependent receptor n=1 Tax=Glaciecola sp. XM2 TaxID=1914931 RepID=UPI001BDDD1F0|nr:TonB-dependent receptor [Glaciecola sp. XM2]MBT1449491.1 TonB-dependent receptor [Glaciecola sp. XM2]